MSTEFVQVDISLTGEVVIQGVGFKGDACTKATAALEKALGKTQSRARKPEFYHQTNQQQKATR